MRHRYRVCPILLSNNHISTTIDSVNLCLSCENHMFMYLSLALMLLYFCTRRIWIILNATSNTTIRLISQYQGPMFVGKLEFKLDHTIQRTGKVSKDRCFTRFLCRSKTNTRTLIFDIWGEINPNRSFCPVNNTHLLLALL